MYIHLFRRMMETQTSDGGAGSGGNSGATATSASPAPVAGRVENPDFGELADFDESLFTADDDDVAAPSGAEASVQTPVVPPVAPVQAPPAPAAQATTAVPGQAPPQPPAAATTPPQVTPPAAETQQPPASATAPATSTEPNTIEQHREKALPELAKLYSIPAEMVEELRVTPETALPKLAAQLHFEVVMSAYQAVMQQMPQMISGFMQHNTGIQKANDDFFAAWPDLKGDTNVETVRNSIKAYKAANPKATTEELIRGAGALAMISLGKTPTIQQPAAAAAPTPPRMVPARPAGVGASAAPFATAPGNSGAPAMNDVEALVQGMLDGSVD